mmetsp:Transcript_24316/g.52106  ORF Transcript_24316/g.52106 Transcript_24316/m.52106 type:complete len:233 (-) Transcript_24316:267-965(-)
MPTPNLRHQSREPFSNLQAAIRSTLSTSSSLSLFSFMNSLMYTMGSIPSSMAFFPLISRPWSRFGGRCLDSRSSLSPANRSAIMSTMSCTASRSFIFMKGQVAHPPAAEQPSPPATPGTTSNLSPPISSSSSTPMTASDETGNTISASTFWHALESRMSCTLLTMDVTMPASVPSMNLSLRFSLEPSAAASSTFRSMKLSMLLVLPTTPSSSRLFLRAIWNISPGTSRWAVT